MISARTFLEQLIAPYLTLKPSILQEMERYLHPIHLEAGQMLYPYGKICRDVVLLTQGLVRAYYIYEARDVNLRLLCGPAVVAAFSSLIEEAPSEEWVEAVTEIRGYRAELAPLQYNNPLLYERIHRILAQRHYLALERRLKMLQCKSALERYTFFCERMEPDIVNAMPGYHVASYLGISPETLSRIRKKKAD